jgi:hypothetical protein
VPPVLAQFSDGVERRGGVVGYPLKLLYEEVAFVAYHFHWGADAVLSMEHADRRRWVQEISAINERRNKEQDEGQAQPFLP